LKPPPGDDGSFITNTGRLTSRAIAITAGVGISTSSKDAAPAGGGTATAPQSADEAPKGGEFTFKGEVKATATASGITVGSGADTVTNTNEVFVKGSATVLINNMPAARVGDNTAHGGIIAGPGCVTVMIGG